MRIRQQQRPEAEFQMAPMIDMVFLLIVFFLYAGSQVQAMKVREIELPESGQSQVTDDIQSRIVLTLEPDGSLYWGQEALPLNQLELRLGKLLSQQPEISVTLRADQATPYRESSAVLSACQQAGATTVIFATLQTD